MHVRVLFFGATADETGLRSIDFPIECDLSVQAAVEEILKKFPRLRRHRLLFAVNQNYVSENQKLQNEDELAVFAAVSGG